ncbi:hypothetical protein HanRHA438_Chr16g0748741 [Helianthus annuus]|nr:hypothetical protein HanIR_Chr16g0800581 [Helianthus annuus]KAJ0834886.1 hypothetical protein HanRHA438_Chr16g0748741 [Helianthus annuus]
MGQGSSQLSQLTESTRLTWSTGQLSVRFTRFALVSGQICSGSDFSFEHRSKTVNSVN